MTTYETAVAEARTLVTRSEEDRWRLAQLTWEQVQAGKSRAQWARDIGVDQSAAARWYLIWEQWSGVDRDQRPTWTAAWDQALGRDERVARHGSQYAAEAITAFRNQPPERKAEAVREALAEPEVNRAVFADAPTRRRATAAIHKSHADDERNLSQARQERVETGERPDFERSIDVTALCADLASVVMRTDRITGMMDRLTERDRTLLAFSARRAQASVDYLAGLEGNASVDDELSELFGGEQA